MFSAAAPVLAEESLYPATRVAKTDIEEAVKAASNRNVLVVWGADWCSDCYELESVMQSEEVKPVIEKNFVVVHADLGQGDKNLDLLKKYKVPVTSIPAFTILDSTGKLLHSQNGGEFKESDPKAVLKFLKRWSPKTDAQAKG